MSWLKCRNSQFADPIDSGLCLYLKWHYGEAMSVFTLGFYVEHIDRAVSLGI
jgi:hypothetical protein